MKYFAIDIETTDLDVTKAQVLQLSMVFEDTNDIKPIEELPKLNLYIHNDPLIGSPATLKFNEKLLTYIQNHEDELTQPCDVPKKVIKFIYDCLEIPYSKIEKINYTENDVEKQKVIFPKVSFTLAGKNIQSFDIPIIQNNFNLFWSEYNLYPKHRYIEPTIVFTDFENDDYLPDLKTCLKRANVEFDEKSLHDATYDSIAIIQLCRKWYVQ